MSPAIGSGVCVVYNLKIYPNLTVVKVENDTVWFGLLLNSSEVSFKVLMLLRYQNL